MKGQIRTLALAAATLWAVWLAVRFGELVTHDRDRGMARMGA